MTGYENGAVTSWTPCVVCGKHLSRKPGEIHGGVCRECREAVNLVRDNKDALEAIIRMFTEPQKVEGIPVPGEVKVELLKDGDQSSGQGSEWETHSIEKAIFKGIRMLEQNGGKPIKVYMSHSTRCKLIAESNQVRCGIKNGKLIEYVFGLEIEVREDFEDNRIYIE